MNTKRAIDAIRRAPLIRQGLRALYGHHFATASGWQRMFSGVYSSFEEATLAAPKTKKMGYDNPESALMHVDNYRIINPCDYPVMFWLKGILPACKVLFDLGGNVGISYYSYEKYLEFPPGLQWIVYDVPEVAREGRELAKKENCPGLSFTSDLSQLDGAGVLLANGAIQFVKEPISNSLRALKNKPSHLLINKTPMLDRPQFVTLQTLGTAFCPYYIFNRSEFIDSICKVGYELIDSWHNAELSCQIPFYPDHRVTAYTGLYFTKV